MSAKPDRTDRRSATRAPLVNRQQTGSRLVVVGNLSAAAIILVSEASWSFHHWYISTHP